MSEQRMFVTHKLYSLEEARMRLSTTKNVVTTTCLNVSTTKILNET